MKDISEEVKEKYSFPKGSEINYGVSGKYATAKKVVVRDFLTGLEPSYTFNRYQKEQINEYLKSPDRNEKALRDMSIMLYNISNLYRSVINFYANAPTFAYVIAPTAIESGKPINTNAILSQYNKVKEYVQNMNIAHEFGKCLITAFKEDIFYGYIISEKNSWTMMRLDANYCKLSGIVDGCFSFGFDFQYFTGREDLVPLYPQEFQQKFNAFKSDAKLRWQELDDKNTICIKINEDVSYVLPPFVSMFSDLANIQDYKDLYKAATELENYKLLHATIPTDKDGSPIIDAELAKDYYRQMSNQLPENIGLAMSPFEIGDFKFDKSNINREDEIREAEEAAIRSAGIAPLILGSSKNISAAAAKISLTVNETLVFRVLRQIERNINRILKGFSGTQKFHISILNITAYNEQEKFNNILKSGTYGMPVRSILNAIIGVPQPDLEALMLLENSLLGLPELERPMQQFQTQPTSGVTSTLDQGGRPTNESQGIPLQEAGTQTQEGDTNANRA